MECLIRETRIGFTLVTVTLGVDDIVNNILNLKNLAECISHLSLLLSLVNKGHESGNYPCGNKFNAC